MLFLDLSRSNGTRERMTGPEVSLRSTAGTHEQETQAIYAGSVSRQTASDTQRDQAEESKITGNYNTKRGVG